MGDLSAHFSRREFACKCGCGTSAPHPDLVDALEELRALLGAPVVVKSGTRCRDHNKACGGVRTSQHLVNALIGYSRAADISSPGRDQRAIYEAALGVRAFASGGIGVYRGTSGDFVHVDVRGVPARWAFVNGEQANMVVALAHHEEEEKA
jgi:uncharacterized protein YcbK (DUF882 family)